MSSEGISQPDRHAKRAPPPVPKPRHLRNLSQASSSGTSTHTTVFSKYLMNDIARGTSYSVLMNSLLSPAHVAASGRAEPPKPHVQCSLVLADSRLDDELSVAKIEFTDTPRWLQELSHDPAGFPKKTQFGTLWRFPDLVTRDAAGQTEFIRAVKNGKEPADILYPEMLAEFAEVDVNVQDARGRTALHWASEGTLPDIVGLCLCIPDCIVGLHDNDGFTAFDLSLRSGDEGIPAMFYHSAFEIGQHDPQEGLLRMLTFTDPADDVPQFPGQAMFDPVKSRNLPLVTALLRHSVDLTTRNSDGNTALHVAAGQVGTAAIAAKLLEAGADVNALGMGGGTPLHHAASAADEEMVQTLLQWTDDLTTMDTDGRTAVECAAGNTNIGVTQILEDHQALELAEKSESGLRESSESVADVDGPNNTPAWAEQRATGEPDLIGQGENFKHEKLDTTEGLDPAKASEADSLVSLGSTGTDERNDRLALIEKGLIGNIDEWDDELHDAVNRRDLDTMIVLRRLGADMRGRHDDGSPILSLAAHMGFLAGVKMLLDAGANIKAVDSYGNTALHQAVQCGHNDVVETLLTAGADTEATDDFYSETALHRAVRCGHNDVVKTLLAAGANIEAVDREDHTALHLAARDGKNDVVETLLVAGADIEALDWEDHTALHLATRDGQKNTAWTLSNARANIQAVDTDSHTALHLAGAFGQNAVVETPRANGANIDVPAQGNTEYELAPENEHKYSWKNVKKLWKRKKD